VNGSFQPDGQVGDYTLLRRLAAGGMGQIWLAERKGISGVSRRVVIKTILECFVDEPSLVDMFLDEGRIAAGLTHSNIAQTYDLGQVGRTYYIAMEYIKGRDLRNLLLSNVDRGHLLPLNLVLRIILETCEGLFYAHSWKTPDGRNAGIIHRDISPQNILVTFDGKVKIIDFGIAKAAQRASQTQSGVLKGKDAYMSPEQVRGREIDHRSDLFSLGVVMYELLTARRLFKRESELSTLDAVLQAEVPPLTRLDGSVPREGEAVLQKAVAREPERRFEDARKMQLAIEEVMLTTRMPASSAHLAAYMDELFEEDLQQEREQEQESLSRLGRKMEKLPGVDDRAPLLERTRPYTPGLNLDRSTESRKRELTRNLLADQPQKFRPRAWAGWKWALLAVLALSVAVGSWFLVGTMVDQVSHTDRPDKPDKPDKPDQFEKIETGDAFGLDLTDPSPGDGGPKTVPPAARGRLSVVTEPPADIFLGRRKLGRGRVKSVRVKAGRHLLRVVAGPGSSKTVKVQVPAGKSITKRVVFGTGKLRVVIMPWADVTVDGKPAGQTPMAPIELLEGTHQVRLANPSLGKETTRTVKIRPDQETLLRLDWR